MPLPGYGNSQVDPGVWGGVNSMQYGAGLMPGGIPQPQGFQTPMFPPPYVMPQAPANFGSGVSPFPRPMGMFTPVGVQMPFGSAFGQDSRMQQQRSQGMGYQMGSYAQTGMGVAARMGGGMAAWSGGASAGAAIGTAIMPGIGTAVGGFLGGMAGSMGFEASGMGNFAQRAGEGIMAPFHQATMRAAQIQNSSMNYVRSGSDLGMGGAGLSFGAARTTQNNLMNMADSRQFQRETGGRFNRQDVMRISQLAGEMGMLDQAQTATEIATHVTKISKALSNVMKIAGEPDVRNAMKMMGQLRSTGMNVGESQTAVTNARTFARMAGVSTGDVMSMGMQGAGVFQQQGMTAAAGLNAGMAAAGMAGMAATALSPRQLALMGGREGIQQNLTSGAAAAGSLDVTMMSMVSRQGGQMNIDPARMRAMISGRTGLGTAIGQTAVNFNDPNAIQEFSYRRGELRDQMQRMMGPQASVLMPMIQAIQVARAVPGMTLGAAFRTLGMDEQQANTFQTLARSREFWSGVRQQINESKEQALKDKTYQREMIKDAASHESRIGAGFRDTISAGGGNISDWWNKTRRNAAEEDDAEVTAETRGSRFGVLGLARPRRFRTKEMSARAVDSMRERGSAAQLQQITQSFLAAQQGLEQDREGVERRAAEYGGAARWAAGVAGGVLGAAVGTLAGPAGTVIGAGAGATAGNKLVDAFMGGPSIGLDQAARGGSTQIDLIRKQMRGPEALAYAFKKDYKPEEVENRTNRTIQAGGYIEKAMSATKANLLAADVVGVAQFSGAKKKVDKAQYDRFTAKASSRIAAKASEYYNKVGPHYKLQLSDIEEELRQAATDAGLDVNDPKIKEALKSQAVQQAVMNDAYQGASAPGKTVLQDTRERGTEALDLKLGGKIDLSRKALDQVQSNAAKKLGLDTAWFSDSPSEEVMKTVGNIVSGNDEDAAGRREVLRLLAMESTGSNSEGAAALRKQLRERGIDVTAVEKDVREQLGAQGLSESQQKDLLGQLSGKSVKALEQFGTSMLNTTKLAIFSGGIADKVGKTAADKFLATKAGKGDMSAYVELANDADAMAKLSEEERKMVTEAGKGGTAGSTARDALTQRFMQKGEDGGLLSGNFAEREKGESDLEKTIGEIQAQAEKLDTDQFTVSVGELSLAAKELRKAANVLRDKNEMEGLGATTAAGDPAAEGAVMGAMRSINDWGLRTFGSG